MTNLELTFTMPFIHRHVVKYSGSDVESVDSKLLGHSKIGVLMKDLFTVMNQIFQFVRIVVNGWDR